MAATTDTKTTAQAAHPGAPVKLARPETTLRDKYVHEQGTIFLSGIQALVRVLLDQHRADQRAGLDTATFVSGYQGSPLGAFDKEVMRLGEIAAEHAIEFQTGLNEELAATAVYGSQLVNNLPGPTRDGVVGVWYGKNPGLDRAMDALRHANFAGTHPQGGALALVGDDPSCKSSTLPSAGEATLAALHMPTFYPGTLQEVLDFGLHAIACSRASGLWSALKVVTSLADAAGTAQIWPERVAPVLPENSGTHKPSGHLLAPTSLQLDVQFHLALARATGNPTVETLMRALIRQLEIARDMAMHAPAVPEWTIDIHERTLAAVRAGDLDEVETVMDQHLAQLEQTWNHQLPW